MTTKEFLSHFPGFCIQTFDDCNEKGKVKDPSLISVGRPTDYTSERIKELNARGAGIYFTPNKFPSGVRRATECKGVNAWIVENDTLSIDQQYRNLENSPLKPSFIVQSKNSLHAYWLAENGTIGNYQKIVKGLIKHFRGDEACKDVSRVFRVPGFFHQKDRKNPFLVGLVEENPVKYTEEQMFAAFPFEEQKPQLQFNKNINTENFWEMLGSLDNKSVLVRLSGQPIVNHEIIEFKKRTSGGEYIYVNGQMCDAWIDAEDKIGSGKGGGPTWIQWLSFYGTPKSEIARWAKDNLVEAKEWEQKHEVAFVANKPVAKEPIIKTNYKKRYTWGTRSLDTSFAIIKRGNFVVIGAKRNSGKTTYTFDMAAKNAALGHSVLYISLEMDEERIKENIARNYSGITIEEELDYAIPEHKQKAFERKISEINAISNLHFRGVRRASDTQWSAIEAMIGDVGDVDLIFIDNLDLIEGQKGDDDLARQKRIVKNILGFTSKYKIPIVLIHHYRKSGQQQKDKGMDEMAGSGKIADGADIILKISRNQDADAQYPEKYQTTLNLQKGRGYPEATRCVYFIKGTFMDVFPDERRYNEQESAIDLAIKEFNGELL